MMRDRRQFYWHSFDVNHVLPADWKEDILSVVTNYNKSKTIIPTSVTSRESPEIKSLPVKTVGGLVIKSKLPWLVDLYTGLFRELAQTISSELVSTARDDRYAVNLNVQLGQNMRYEAHADSNPIEGLLYVTSHGPDDGGELVVGNRLNDVGIRQIDEDATRVYPVSGHLVFFDARLHSHYVAPLKQHDATRIVAAMNFYTPSSPETARPEDLNRHLGIE